jgi:hypothetical protein
MFYCNSLQAYLDQMIPCFHRGHIELDKSFRKASKFMAATLGYETFELIRGTHAVQL